MQNKRRRNKASKFIPNLHKILSDKESGAFWRDDGKTFVLSDISKLISNSLPKYFRHSNISSFIRQLNLYGFKKLVGQEIEQNTYYHQKFKKNYITQLKPIRSFYNQQKYGRLRKSRNAEIDQIEMQSIQSNEQQDYGGKTSGFSELNSENNYKQRIAILQKQNERLRLIEQEHINLVNMLNGNQKAINMYNQWNEQPINNYINFYETLKGITGISMEQIQNYEYNTRNEQENKGDNFCYYQNAYYIPFQSII